MKNKLKLFKKAEQLGIPFDDLKTLLKRKVLLIRHAPTCFNGEDEKIRSIVDVPLDEDGLLCANNVGIELRNSGLECIYTSDMIRGTQTSRAIALNTGAQIEVLPDLRAWNLGSLAGANTKDVEGVIADLMSNPNKLPPGSKESFNQFKSRTLAGYYTSLGFDGDIAIVTHYSNTKVILEHLGKSDDLEPGEVLEIG